MMGWNPTNILDYMLVFPLIGHPSTYSNIHQKKVGGLLAGGFNQVRKGN